LTTFLGSSNVAFAPANVLANLASGFISQILVSVTKGNSKVLASPNLIIQEGSSAQVNLTEEVFAGFEVTSTSSAAASGGSTASNTVKTVIKQAGVILNVTLDRIDDNGFLTLNVSPEVSAPFREYEFVFPNSNSRQRGTLLTQRRLETGKIRLRDGQTLVLSGIIRDTDKQELSKVPILGDIPLLGRLFRRERGTKERSELVVIVTPQVMDDSDQSTVGYQYVPGAEAQKLLNK
jgi:type IV pilus assembly protein PilQ